MALRTLFLLLICWLGGFLWAPVLAADAHRPPAVLVLSSYGQGGASMDEYVRVLKDELYSAGVQHDSVYIEYLALGITYNSESQRNLTNLLLERYFDKNIVAIATVQQPAFDFLYDKLDELAPHAAVIGFAAHATTRSLASSRQAVCQPYLFDYAGTATHALGLFPNTQRIVFFTGSSATELARFDNLRKQVHAVAPHVQVEDTHTLSYAEALHQLSHAPPDTVVFAFGYTVDIDGVSRLSPIATTLELVKTANVPVFVAYDLAMGTGAIGGVITFIGQEARASARWIIQHMGKSHGLGPVQSPGPHALFDWQQLQRWQGQVDQLPQGVTFINKPPTVWDQYRAYILATSGTIAALTALVILLLLERRKQAAAQRQLQQSEQHLRILVESAPEAILVYDHDSGSFIDANKNAETLLGCTRAELLRSSPARFYTPAQAQSVETTAQVHAHFSRVVGGDSPVSERTIYTADHREVVCEVRSVLLPWPHRKALRISYVDITERRTAHEHIHQQAFFDPLTQLSNKRFFVDRLCHAIATYRRNQSHGALLLLNLDSYKDVTDAMGRGIGDKLLVQVSLRLQACLREVDLAARLGGDEFAVLVESLSACEDAAHSQTLVVCKKILLALRTPLYVEDRPFACSASMGAVVFGAAPIDAHTLFQQGEAALYHAKNEGGNTVQFFDAQTQATAVESAALASDLREAIDTGQIQVFYQPQVNATGHIIGAEALARWYHPSKAFISPAKFIPIAEQAGLIGALGLAVLRDACEVLQRWSVTPDCEHWKMSVNLSAHQLQEKAFVDDVLAVLNATRANPRRLTFEITDRVLLTQMEANVQAMDLLCGHGITFSLDNFGSSCCALSSLRRLPLAQLNIDLSFVQNAPTDTNAATITQTAIAVGQSLGLSVLAKGVETQEQHTYLARKGCNAYQGFLFGKPMPIASFNLARACGLDEQGNPPVKP